MTFRFTPLSTCTLLLAACFYSALVHAWTCTPIKTGCVCQTPKTLSCTDLSTMRKAIVNKMNSLGAGSELSARFKGGIVRLAFHDPGEFSISAADTFADGSPRYRADGCVDMAFAGNAGLDVPIANLDALWAPFCSKISRADFWYFAAKVVIEESTPYVKKGDPAFRIKNFTLPFFTGRIDRKTCPTIAGTASMLPEGEGGANEIKRTLMDNLGLDVQHTTAILGAHVLGGAAASGYSGKWADFNDVFTTHYYQSLLLWGFERTPMTDPTTGKKTLQQWNIDQATSADPVNTAGVFMMSTDMALVYDVDHSRESLLTPAQQAALAKECGPPMSDEEFNSGADTPSSCPYQRFDNPQMNFEFWVRQYGDFSGNQIDGPGADKFLPAFARAFQFVSEIGYNAGELTCSQCTPTICTDKSCTTANVQCGLTNKYTPKPRTPAPTTTTAKPITTAKATPAPPTAKPTPAPPTPKPTPAPPTPKPTPAPPTAKPTPVPPPQNVDCNPVTKKDSYGRSCTPPTTAAPTYAPSTPAPDNDDDTCDDEACDAQAAWERGLTYDAWVPGSLMNECADESSVPRTSVTTGCSSSCSRRKSDGAWQLVFNDEFNGATGTQPNYGVWVAEQGLIRNQEIQTYTSEACNLFLRDGALVIKALNTSNKVTSASIYSQQSFTYGRFEARIKVPTGRGIWAAFWLLGIDFTTLGWPWCGEIAMEYFGYSAQDISGTIQSADLNGFRGNPVHGATTAATTGSSFQLYTIDWTPTAVTIFVDGVFITQLLNDGSCRSQSWPFDRPFNIKLNLAIGGNPGGQQGVDPAIFPAEMVVDYVRVFQRTQPDVCKAHCAVTRFYYVAESYNEVCDAFATKVMTVPATYDALKQTLISAIVTAGVLSGPDAVYIDAISPYKTSTGLTRMLVNFTVRDLNAARAATNMASAAAKQAAASILGWLAANVGSTWSTISVGKNCPDCYTPLGAPVPRPYQNFQLPTTIPFASYDFGGELVGYHDLSAWNSFGTSYYRSGPDYVDIVAVSDKPVVGAIDTLDWLLFSGINTPACTSGYAGANVVVQTTIRAANGMSSDGQVKLQFIPLNAAGDEVACTTAATCPIAQVAVPVTWAWIWYASTPAVPVTLTCGTRYRMKATFPVPYYNIESVTFAI